STSPLLRQWWSSWSDEYGGILRVPRTAEWFNRLAWRINQLRRGRPLCLADLRFARAGGVMRIQPDPPTSWDPAPHDFHLRVPEWNLAAWESLVDDLRGWISTEAEMPASWHAAKSVEANGADRLDTSLYCLRTCSGASTTSVEDDFGTRWYIQCTANYQLQGTHTTIPLQPIAEVSRIPLGLPRWISDGSAAAMANAIGVAMIRTRLGYGFRMMVQAPTPPRPSAWNVNAYTHAMVFGAYEYEPEPWQVEEITAPALAIYFGGNGDRYDYALGNRLIEYQATRVYQRPAITLEEAEFIGRYPYYLSRASDGRDQLDIVTNCPGSSLEPASQGAASFDGTIILPDGGAEGFRTIYGEYHLAADTGLDDAAIGNQRIAIAVTAHSGSSLRNDSKVAVTPTWLFHRQANFQNSEATWVHLRNYFGGGGVPRPGTYEAPNPAGGGLVACSGQATVIAPPGSAAFISAKFEIVVDLDVAP
ncbi:MAG: hypothetical protein ACYC23_25045, partial [Limisphaerales bacterium]